MTTIRRADVRDVPQIAQIVNDSAEYGLMLHRSLEFLYERVRDFFVAVDDGRPQAITGVSGLSVIWADLAEVYSLAVHPQHRRKGIGRKLVEKCLEEAKRLGIPRVMALTYEQRFFASLGFEVLDRQKLPLKVWSDCLHCPKNQACDEIAMLRALADVPAVAAPKPGTPPSSEYVLPVVAPDADKPGQP